MLLRLKYFVPLFFVLFSLQATAGLSPLRAQDRDYRSYFLPANSSAFYGVLNDAPTVYKSRRLQKDIAWKQIPEMSAADLHEAFVLLRDEKKLLDGHYRWRRLPWYFPDSGCFARAESMVNRIESRYGISPFKLFAFGNLVAKTAYEPSGLVKWWYHVAPVVRVNSLVYVLDPSIEHARPLTLEEWKAALHYEPEFALCNPHSYDPNSNCKHSSDDQAERARIDLGKFLTLEWDRLLELGKNPAAFLL